jgi:hypothetical protein
MSITIHNPTAEDAYQALQSLPKDELARLLMMFSQRNDETAEEEEAAWRQASAQSANRFFEDEEA